MFLLFLSKIGPSGLVLAQTAFVLILDDVIVCCGVIMKVRACLLSSKKMNLIKPLQVTN